MKMREFVEKTGIKRTTLQLQPYKDILKPDQSKRQWEYDDEALENGARMSILKEVGFSIDQIKEILDDDERFLEALDSAIAGLQEKITRYEGYVNYLNMIKLSADNAELLEPIFSQFTLAELLEKSGGIRQEMDVFAAEAKATAEKKLQSADNKECETDDDPVTDEVVMKTIQVIDCLPMLMEKESPDGPNVQETLRRLFEYWNMLAEEAGKEPGTIVDFVDMIVDVVESDRKHALKDLYGERCVDYICRAAEIFGACNIT